MLEMMVAMLLVSLAAAALLAHYFHHLPDAPECPACKALTSEATNTRLADRLCAPFAASSVRCCLRCGWSGRMRWRPAARRVHRDGGG